MGLRHPTTKSFGYAFEGVKTAFKREPNFRLHIIIALAVLTLGILLRLSLIEWLILTYTIFFVIVLELLNTAIEALVNLVSPNIQPEAKVAKDVSAAMVFVAAILAIIIGIMLFAPKILTFILRTPR